MLLSRCITASSTTAAGTCQLASSSCQ
jgi:hypothetical protein